MDFIKTVEGMSHGKIVNKFWWTAPLRKFAFKVHEHEEEVHKHEEEVYKHEKEAL